MGVRDHAETEMPPRIDEVFRSDRLDQMLAQSDYVVLAAPLTPATRGLMNAKRLAFMKPDAYVINVGRGPLIDDAALIEALTERRIGGAGIDVFEQETPAGRLTVMESRQSADHSSHCGTDGKTVAAALRSFLSEPAALRRGRAVAFRCGQAKRVLTKSN